MANRPKKTYNLKINEDVWVCKLFDNEAYEKQHGAKSEAITLPSKKEVHFKLDGLTKPTIGHEIFHVYWEYLYLESATDLQVTDVEEIIAEFISNNYKRYAQKIELVYKGLKL